MGFSNQEVINISRASLLASVLDSNGEAVWYEKTFPYEITLPASKVWTEISDIPEASNLTKARQGAQQFGRIIADYSRPNDSLALSEIPGSNKTTFGAYTSYMNFSSDLLGGWIQPQRVLQRQGASLGQPSFGYTVRLFNGDPATGGTAISPTSGGSGSGQNKTVSWVFNYSMGILFLSQDFFDSTGISKANFNPYITGFRYTGLTLEDAQARSLVRKFFASENILIGSIVRVSSGRDTLADPGLVGGVLNAQAINDNVESYSAVGVALETVLSGNDLYISTAGQANILMDQQVTINDIGKRVFLSKANPGKGTLTAPNQLNDSVVAIGRLMTSQPNSFMQECYINVEHVAHIG